MNNRFKELRNYLKLTQSDFAEKIGIKGSSYCDIENGKAPITERTIITICSIFNVNRKWLETGKGEMFSKYLKNIEFFEIYSTLLPKLQNFLLKTAKNLLDLQNDN